MQVSVAQSPLSQSQLAPQRQDAASTARPAPIALDSAPDSPADDAAVSLHSAAEIQALEKSKDGAGHSAVVFAEIWKDGAKVGSVYTDGHAELPSMLAGAVAGGHSATAPYIRAQEISRLVGGEVRFTDLPALQVAQTRKQLSKLYSG